ncbi:MAG TPA: GNAT family N-acetyltransferase [Candidatus Kryptonia bacterium]
MIIRQANSGDADAIAGLLSKSFLEDTSVIRVSIESNPRYTLSDMYVAEEKAGGVLGCLRITPFEVCSLGVRMPMAGIAAVAVQPEARRGGIAETLMQDALKRMYEMDYPISMLFPFKHHFYKKFGYAYVGNTFSYEFSPNNISPFAERSHVRPFVKSDRSKVKRVLQQYIERHGRFTPMRNDNFWDLVVLPKFKDAYVYDDGEIKGYVVYELYKDSSSEPVINIKEFVGLESSAHRGLWGFIGALGDQITRLKFLAPYDYPVHIFLKEPREQSFDRLFFEYKSFATLASGFMLRVINIPAALKLLNHNFEPQVDFVLKVSDGNLQLNSRVFKVHLHSGETVVEEGREPAQFETDIEIFSQIYSGFLNPLDALKYGFARGDTAVAAKISELFRGPSPFIYQFDIF